MTRENPFVSIIMNCYNGGKYLKESLDSIIAQTFDDWELIFWDNKSTDNSADILKSYREGRFRYFYAEDHTPLGPARNHAIRKARGKWVGFLDCDDIWLPRKLEKQVALIRKPPFSDLDIGLVYGRTLYQTELVGRTGYFEKGRYVSRRLPQGNIFPKLIEEDFISMASGLVRRDIISDGGIPDKYTQSEDYWLFLKAAYGRKCVAVQDFCCIYRIHNTNLSRTQVENGFEEAIDILKSYHNKASGVCRAIRYTASGYALYCIKSKAFKKAVRLLEEAGNPLLMLEFIYKYLKRNWMKKNLNLDSDR